MKAQKSGSVEWNLGRLPVQVCQAGGFHSVKGRRAYNVSCQRLSKMLPLLVKPALGFYFFLQVCLIFACLSLLWLLVAAVVGPASSADEIFCFAVSCVFLVNSFLATDR